MAITAQAAEHNGFIVDRSCYPWMAYKGPRFRPDETTNVITPAHNALELQIGDVDRIARHAWETDGKPDGREPGEVNYETYRTWARVIIDAAREKGWTINRTTPRPLGPG